MLLSEQMRAGDDKTKGEIQQKLAGVEKEIVEKKELVKLKDSEVIERERFLQEKITIKGCLTVFCYFTSLSAMNTKLIKFTY